MAEKYFIGPKFLGELRDTVGRVQQMPKSSDVFRVPTVLQELQFWDADGDISRGTFTHAMWTIGGTMAVVITGSTNTVQVTNYCVPVKGQTNATQTLNVLYANVMGTMTAVEIQQPTCTLSVGGLDVTLLPGYVAGEVQLLGHGAANTASTACTGLQWFSITQCGTATAS